MVYVIRLIGNDPNYRFYVESFSNVYATPLVTPAFTLAKPFQSREDAAQWASRYLPSYDIVIDRLPIS